MSKKVKIFGVVVIVIAVIIFATSFLGKKKIDAPAKSTSPLSSSTGAIPLPGVTANTSKTSVDEFSSLLSSIKSITIDTSLFSNPAYKMFRDFPVSLGSDIVGRTNPFAPVGTDVGGNIPADVVIQTLQSGKISSTTAEFGAQVTVADTVPTSVIFEYGISDTFGSATPVVVVTKSGTVLSTATKLLPETTYYVRAVAARGSNTTNANITSFTTTKK